MKTLGHHTILNTGNRENLRTPFKSFNKVETHTFLGEGYYFWDNNIEIARWWGKVHYNNKYYIFKGELLLTKEHGFFDLVGNREDMLHLMKLVEYLQSNGIISESWELGKVLQLLIKFNKEPQHFGIFPYNIVRVVEVNKLKKEERVKFATHLDKFTTLQPKIMICIYELKLVILRNYSFLEEN